MAYRFKHDNLLKHLVPYLPSDSTGGGMGSSDIGKLVTLSSAKVGLLQGTSLAPTPNTIAGVLHSFPDAVSSVSAGSTVRVYVKPISPSEVLEVDVSTAYSGSTANLLVTTNIGYYFKTCTTEGIAGGGSSVLSPGVLGGYLNYSSAAAAADTSHFLKLVGFDNDRRVAFVQINSTNLAQ